MAEGTRGLRSGFSGALLAFAIGIAQAAPPSAEDYVKRPFIGEVAMSPSGTRLAVTIPNRHDRMQLAVMELSPLGEPKGIVSFTHADVLQVSWVNDERLVFAVHDGNEPGDSLVRWGGLFAVNRDGSAQRTLITGNPADNMGSRVLGWKWWLHSMLDDGSADIIVARREYDSVWNLQSVLPSRLNTQTGELRSLSTGAPDNARSWAIDHKGRPRALATLRDGRVTVHWKAAGDDAKWEPLGEFTAYEGGGFSPRFIDPQGQMLVSAAKGRDHHALYRFDTVAKQMEAEPLIALQGFDLDQPVLEIDSTTGNLLGLHFRMERPASYWFDAGLRKIQQAIDAALPSDRTNRLYCGRCSTSRFLVVESASDRLPPEYYLFDREKTSMQSIGSARPWITPATQGTRTFHRVPARDGLSLPVYLTRPPGAKAGQPLPAVVLVHGGPFLRGHDLTWDEVAQFLASRGYLVIETDYRGSTGYGFKHFRAGWKQWGRAMQDDLADSVAWALKEGFADSKRVCIMGGRYGGYAALMGPIRDPSVYRCVVSYAGVSDIDLMYDIVWSDLSEEWKGYGMPRLIGDREKDAAQLAEASPLRQAAKIKVPVLLAHGGDDRRVPVEHSRKFRAAAEAAGVKVEWLFYPDEGHGFRAPANRADFLRKVEAFLAREIGTDASR